MADAFDDAFASESDEKPAPTNKNVDKDGFETVSPKKAHKGDKKKNEKPKIEGRASNAKFQVKLSDGVPEVGEVFFTNLG